MKQIYLGGIPNSLTYDELHRYFSKYGRIEDLKLLNNYGFLSFESDEACKAALEEKHVIDGLSITTELSNGPRRRRDSGYRSKTPERYRSRSPPRYRSRTPEKYRSRTPDRYRRRRRSVSRTPEKYRRYRSRTPERRRRSSCDYCDRCEVHGKYRSRRGEYRRDRKFSDGGHPNNRLKIVLDNISSGCEVNDLKELGRKYNLDVAYARVTSIGNHGIMEFRNLDDKEVALSKLDGIEFMGNIVSARPYWVRERGGRSRSRSPSRERKMRKIQEPEHFNENIYEGINNEQKDDEVLN